MFDPKVMSDAKAAMPLRPTSFASPTLMPAAVQLSRTLTWTCLQAGQGNAQAELAFPLTGRFDGIFVLTRNVSGQHENEFVTGFVR